MKQLKVNLGSYSYPVYFQQDGRNKLPEIFKKLGIAESVYVITDSNVLPLYGNSMQRMLKKANMNVCLHAVPAGEQSKCLNQLDEIYTWLLQNNANRQSIIIALGGGVIGDLAGFAAATFMRGVPFIQIPTTVLSQVDSSVGGKVGINHDLGKNLIGAFYQPLFVLIDPVMLKTLPEREIRAGSAEIIKYGFIKDRTFYDHVVQRLDDLLTLSDLTWIERILAMSCRYKARVVENDEKEKGQRAILNFGHTIGHGLEAATHYNYFLHGEAVVHGMKAALYLSHAKGYISVAQLEECTAVLQKFKAPPVPQSITEGHIFDSIKKDKKRSSKGQTWVLLKSIGSAYLTADVTEKQISKAIQFIFQNQAL